MKNFGLSELIQSGILVTLLTMAFGLGKVFQRLEQKLDEHDRRIEKIETKIFSGKSDNLFDRVSLSITEDPQKTL